MDPGSSILQPRSSCRPSADGEEGVFMMTLRDKVFEQLLYGSCLFKAVLNNAVNPYGAFQARPLQSRQLFKFNTLSLALPEQIAPFPVLPLRTGVTGTWAWVCSATVFLLCHCSRLALQTARVEQERLCSDSGCRLGNVNFLSRQ